MTESNKKYLCASLIMILLVSMIVVTMVTMTSVTSASPSPDAYFYVYPSEVRDVSAGNYFVVHINVSDAPLSYAWEFTLSWDPDLLEPVEHWDPIWEESVNVTEGDFLDRRYETIFGWMKNCSTSFIADPLEEANATGQITVGCSLIGAVDWAYGDGWLATLNFTVKATGSCVLDLQKTRLWDHTVAGSPASTYYPNQDGFFTNTLVHDVAVTSVTANTTSVQPGQTVNITVTVENEGNYTENLNVAVYADVTVYNTTVKWWPDEIVVGDEITIDTYSVTSLGTGATNTTTNINWDTTGLAAEKYYISANVTLTSPADDDPRDNMFIDGKVKFIVAHDLKVNDVTVLTPSVVRGELANMSVEVLNQGTSSESFTLYVNASDTTINSTSTSLSGGANSTYNISWNTTGVAGGDHTISAYLSPVSGEREVDKADNLLVDGTVRVKIYDISITNITIFTPKVYEGWDANMTITVLNNGTEHQSFMFYLFANKTMPSVGPNLTLQVMMYQLDGGASVTISFSWDTSGAVWGWYTLSAEVPVHPNEEDPNDNFLIGSTVHVLIPGDIDGDGDVDSTDFGLFAGKYGSSE